MVEAKSGAHVGRIISPFRGRPDDATVRRGAIVDALREALEKEDLLRLFPHWLLQTIQEEAWRHFCNTTTNEIYEWSDFDAFIKAKRPRGLGIKGGVKQVHIECKFYADQGHDDAIAALRELDRMLPEPMSHQEAGTTGGRGNKAIRDTNCFVGKSSETTSGRGKKAIRDTNSFSGKSSETRAYSLARLKRDHPELADKVINGEMSAYAAAVEAGYRHRLIRIDQIDPEHAAVMIRKNCTADFVSALKAAL
jgi:hypothetical protein